MYFLDDEIKVTYPLSASTTNTTAIFGIQISDDAGRELSTNARVIANGRRVLLPTETELTLDIAQYLRDYAYKAKITQADGAVQESHQPIKWKIGIVIVSNRLVRSDTITDVCMCYRNPRKDTSNLYYNVGTGNYDLPTLQGVEVETELISDTPTTYAGKYALYPRYPRIATDNYTFRYNNFQSETFWGYHQLRINSLFVNHFVFKTGCNSLSVALSSILTGRPNAKDVQIYLPFVEKEVKVAEFDECPARYYLMWQDRFGGIQSQPFGKLERYEEGLNYTNSVLLNNKSKRAITEVSPRITITSDYIPDEVLYLYESIFVSPWLLLYDTKRDTSTEVLVKASTYTENTYRNKSRKMHNLQLSLEYVKKQIIY